VRGEKKPVVTDVFARYRQASSGEEMNCVFFVLHYNVGTKLQINRMATL